MAIEWPRRTTTLAVVGGCSTLLASSTALAGTSSATAGVPTTEVRIDDQITGKSPTSYIETEDPITAVYHDEAGDTTYLEQYDDFQVSSFGHAADDTGIYAAWNRLRQTQSGKEPRVVSDQMLAYTTSPDGKQVAVAESSGGNRPGPTPRPGHRER